MAGCLLLLWSLNNMRSRLLIFFALVSMCMTVSNISFGEDLTFDEWEAGIGGDTLKKRSRLSELQLESASTEELSDAEIGNALQSISGEALVAPAYTNVESEEGIKKDAKVRDLLEEQTAGSLKEAPEVPQAPLFEQGIYNTPNGRILENNMNTVERP